MKLSLPSLLSSVALAGLLTWLLAWHPLSWPGAVAPGRLEVQVAAQSATRMTVRLDEGHGIDDLRPTDLVTDLPADSATRTITMALPPQRVRTLKITFSGTPAVVIAGARLVFEGRAPVDLASQLQPGEATVFRRADLGLMFKPAPGSPTVSVEWHPARPIFLPAGDEPSAIEVAADFLILTVLVLVMQLAFAGRQPGPFRSQNAQHWFRFVEAVKKRPALVLAVVGLGAAVVSSYPVVFCHKSFVSPNTFPYLLYTGRPTLPGVPKEPVLDAKGADVASTMVYGVPNSALEYDALFRDHEFPLWNRYVSAGLPLFGQGQSTLGNPLHFLTVAANGASWAWDLKFVLAKALFCFGLGLCVWSLTRRLGVSALMGASGAWIGFFAYRMNHPAFFSLCFAPWVLWPWLVAVSAGTRRALLGAVIGLVAADWCELTSGTAKEACMILVFLNAAGLLVVALSTGTWGFRVRKLGVMVGASFCFLLLSAPAWLLFLDALQHGVSWYDAPAAYQLPPGLLAGFFDDIFSQDFTPIEIHSHPSANFLALAGVLWLVAGGSGRKRRGAILALVWTAVPLAALVFGVIPPAWLKATPFVGHIYHIFNTFGVPLLIILLLLAGIGLSECLEGTGSRRWDATYRRMVIAFVCLLALYLGHTQAVPPVPLPGLSGDPMWHSGFFLGYSLALIAAVLALPWALRWSRETSPERLAGILGIGVCFVLLHFRHGMYVRTRFDEYVMTPRSAAKLDAPSPALECIRRRLDEPYRTAGLDLAFSPDYNALARLQGISNLDGFSNLYYSGIIRAAGFIQSGYARIFLPPEGPGTLKPVLDFLNLRYYLREPKPGLGPPPELTPVVAADLEVYESREAWPRAFFTDHLVHYGEVADFISTIQHGDGRPLAAVQGGQADPGQPSFADRKIVPASQYRHSTNVTEFSVEAPGPGVIVLGEAFEEGNFRVTMNGEAVPYFRVNHAFKGVKVEKAGMCRLRFEYWPRLLTASLWISAVGVVFEGAGAWWVTRGAGGGGENGTMGP